ncbi:transcriptional protein SWT1 [Bombyx mori]|uniref:WW domain-containing protein n=1 Tax=Bombyx mori TaxID=7091 RepID=A0A8R2C7N6_BOMMO|nr:transcriptional protein SWT1 [Bombyx mori]
MSSSCNETSQLPDGWVLCTSKSSPGRKYYFNKRTGKSSWTQPQLDESKDKSKKEKDNQRDMKSKEEEKKSLKRKNDGSEQNSPIRKQKEAKSSPGKCWPSLNEISLKNVETKRQSTSQEQTQKDIPGRAQESYRHSSSQRESVSRTDSPDRRTPAKNLANTRLTQLRAQLSSEAQKEENKDSTVKKRKMSTDTETSRNSRTEKSPSSSDVKSSTQSPSSESLPSIPSPSQFFAANKIISSMKAQLPEEYCDKVKQKDMFADIEQGIYNQVTEYPYMKHPATPPQFSEASKLVSAIKSKLTYKSSGVDCDLITYSSAQDRLDALRTRLSNDATNAEYSINIPESKEDFACNEAMDVDLKSEIKEPRSNTISPVSSLHEDTSDLKENLVLVVDTNIFIHELDFIKDVLNSHVKGYSEQPTLLVPWRVINELDRLKDNNNGNGAVCKRAKSAMDYLYKCLPENNRIKGQSLRDANSHIYPCELPDDEILNCCLQQAERSKDVALLSNDKNLCNKAVINGVKFYSLSGLRKLLENKPPASHDPDLITGLKYYENAVYQLLSNILENEMRAKYNNLWQHVLLKAPPWTLRDVLQCLLKHWVAVFNDVFPRIQHLILDLKNALTEVQSKDPTTISQSDVSNFKELSLDLAKKCQIIPEYMELAKITVERLSRDARDSDEEVPVIEAFEGLWTVFSSYCAKLSTNLGIVHGLEDSLPHDGPDNLSSKLPIISCHISGLTNAIEGALSIEAHDPSLDEHMYRLETTFKESLASAGMDPAVVNQGNLTVFCIKCRNMLQEAYTKFAQLTELLDICNKNTIFK